MSGLIASVVLPTHGRRESLLRVLRALGQQSVSPRIFEVIVVCDGDVDGSARACRALASRVPYTLWVLEQPNQGPAAARNRGVAEAQSPLIIFLDDDVVPDEYLIAAHLKAQQGQDRRVTIGPLLPPLDTRLNAWGTWEERTLCRQYDDMAAGRWQPTYRQFYTGNASVLKRHIVAAGGFDPAFRRAEDVELALRLHEHGLHFIFLPQARGWHYVRRSFASWLRLSVSYGTTEVAMARRRPELLNIVAKEYPRRNPLVRLVTDLCVGRPATMRIAIAALGCFVRTADACGIGFFASHLCGLIFNVRYYNALAMALGGRASFQRLMHDGYAADLMRTWGIGAATPIYRPETAPMSLNE